MVDDSQLETSINKPVNFNPINWVQWSKGFQNYIAQYKKVQKALVFLLNVIQNNFKRPDVAAMELLSQTEQEYWNIILNNSYRHYVE